MQKLIFLGLFVVLFVACNSYDKQYGNVVELENELYSEQVFSEDKASGLLNSYMNFIANNEGDTASANFLFKAGELGMTLRQFDVAIASFKQLQEEYAECDKMAESFFLLAFTHENYLSDLPQAEMYYRLFLQNYPNHALAKDAEISLQYLGKTPEELIEIFQNQNK